MITVEPYLFSAAILLLISITASKAMGRIGVPALLVFLGVGMLAGSEGLGGIEFDNAAITQALGIVALLYILFAGGLETDWAEIRPVILPGALLSTIGVFITCAATAAFSCLLFDFTWKEGALLGAIVSSTDAAAVFTVLRSQGIGLKNRISPLLEFESGSNDPMAVFLTVGLIHLIQMPEESALILIPKFFQQMAVGAAAGITAGRAMESLFNRIKLEFEGLYPVLSLASVLAIYAGTHLIGGNGFLAVYLAGVTLAQRNFLHRKSLTLFHDGLAWLMQISMFVALGLLVFPSELLPIAGQGVLLSAFLMVVARPLGVFFSLLGSNFSYRERGMISWVGLRGAVPIILATYPLVSGTPHAEKIFNLVFFVVISSVLLQGTTIGLAAKWLKVMAPVRRAFKYPIEYVPTGDFKKDLVEIRIPANSHADGKSVIELGLPTEALIVLIERNGNVIVPRGSTQIEKGDAMLVLADPATAKKVKQALEKAPERLSV